MPIFSTFCKEGTLSFNLYIYRCFLHYSMKMYVGSGNICLQIKYTQSNDEIKAIYFVLLIFCLRAVFICTLKSSSFSANWITEHIEGVMKGMFAHWCVSNCYQRNWWPEERSKKSKIHDNKPCLSCARQKKKQNCTSRSRVTTATQLILARHWGKWIVVWSRWKWNRREV